MEHRGKPLLIFTALRLQVFIYRCYRREGMFSGMKCWRSSAWIYNDRGCCVSVCERECRHRDRHTQFFVVV